MRACRRAVALVPGLTALISWHRGVLVHKQHTTPITIAVALNMSSLLIFMTIFPYIADTSLAGLPDLSCN